MNKISVKKLYWMSYNLLKKALSEFLSLNFTYWEVKVLILAYFVIHMIVDGSVNTSLNFVCMKFDYYKIMIVN